MRKTKMIGMAAVLTAALIMSASAAGFGRHGGMRGGMKCMKGLMRNPELAEQVGITDEQMEKLKAINYAAEKERVQLKANVELAEIEMKQLMESGTADRTAILQASDKVADAQQALHKAGLTRMLDARDVLTADQVKQLEQTMRERRGKRGGRDGRSKRGGRGGGKGRGCMQDGMGPRGCGRGMEMGGPEDAPPEEPAE